MNQNESCHPGSYCPNPSKHEIRLFRKLKELGIESMLSHWDGEKRIDLAVPASNLHIRFRHPGADHVPGGEGRTTIRTVWIDFEEVRQNPDRVAIRIARMAGEDQKVIRTEL